CDSRIEKFDPNEVFSLSLAKSESVNMGQAQEDVSNVIETLFGTPESPTWPNDLISDEGLVQTERLRRAAGGVSSEQDGTHLGLFQEHCVVCHGVSGNGRGPASQFQNPYPRDFRPGIFKWKLTDRAEKPSREDLRRVLEHGIAGTGMPSFSLLAQDDVEALIDYVIYLSVRGELERRLLRIAVASLGYGEGELSEGERLQFPGDEQSQQVIVSNLARIAGEWGLAQDPEDEQRLVSFNILEDVSAIDRGRELFHGKIANCVGCHGVEGSGGVATLDYDDWTKEYTTRLGISPNDKDALQMFREVGAHRPRPIYPRKLKNGVLRGGDDPVRLFRLIRQGIAGTPMPGVTMVNEENGKGLTEAQIWDLVSYLRSLRTN
ncbi:MAG: cytochrome c, partial [Planctomycetota bacterium]|nr:cytochrome c [Planctomycetota bacterium]